MNARPREPEEIGPEEAFARLSSSAAAVLLDVRTGAEYDAKHVPDSVNIPVDELKAEDCANLCSQYQDVLLLCQSGQRAQRAGGKFRAAGFDSTVVQGGIVAWESAQLPIIKTSAKTLPLDAQVRIVAGGLAAVGGLLAVFVNPAFGIIPAFVGSGLVMSGFTGCCPMASLLAKLPWNRGSRKAECHE